MKLYDALYGSPPKHKVFISFHHADEAYKNYIERNWGESADGFISESVCDGDIDPNLRTDAIWEKIRDEYISDATVTLVLIGNDTWKRKYVDWEIGSSLRNTTRNSRTGLLGIVLPTYQSTSWAGYQHPSMSKTENGGFYDPHTIPPRLYDNLLRGYAKIYSWEDDPQSVKEWIHNAYIMRNLCEPDQRRAWYDKNRNDQQTEWRDN